MDRVNLAYRILLRRGTSRDDAKVIVRDPAAVRAIIDAEIANRR